MSYGEKLEIQEHPIYIFKKDCDWFTLDVNKGYYIIGYEMCDNTKKRLWTNLTPDRIDRLIAEGYIELISSHRDTVNHPTHYGGADNPYEAIKVIEAWELNFSLGNAVKYISRCEKKNNKKEDLEKAIWYLQNELKRIYG